MHIPDFECERLNRLYALNLLDTPTEPAFDRIAALAAELLETPIALLALIDKERIWFKARIGLDATHTNCGVSMCRYTLLTHAPLIVEDAHVDPRFSNSPLVTGTPYIRFYAGIPICPDGRHIVATLCVIDTKPRKITPQQQRQLAMLAEQAGELMTWRQQAAHQALRSPTMPPYASSAVLNALQDGLHRIPDIEASNHVWNFLNTTLLRLTESEYALIGEIQKHNNGQPYLKIHTATGLNTASSFCLPPKNKEEASLLERVFINGELVILNNLENSTEHQGCLPNLVHLHNYLGVPIIEAGEVIGMFAIANNPRAFDNQFVEWLTSFRATCALLIRLYRQLNERTHITTQLRQSRDDAERASLAKSEFLSSMSHELRTPLNAILGFTQLLLASTSQPLLARQRRQVEQIQRSGQHLMELISEILDLSCIESGHIRLSIEPVAVEPLLEEVLATLTPLAQQAGITLLIENKSDFSVNVLADALRLEQILINLISNAIKYNRINGTVTLRAQAHGKYLRISVGDTGIGISAEQITQLFQPFNRLGLEGSAIEGTGVGLALTRKLLENMSGKIGVDSREGTGSTFWFELPCTRHTLISTSATLAAESGLHTLIQGNFHSKIINVLCIEDNAANQILLEDLFSDHSEFVVHYANTAAKGLEMSRILPIDIVLMDINLPDMNGRHARALLAQHPTTQHLPVIALSASAMPNDIQQGAEAGFAAYLTKPFNVNQLLHLLHSLVTREPA